MTNKLSEGILQKNKLSDDLLNESPKDKCYKKH